jgi:hypothetical protein
MSAAPVAPSGRHPSRVSPFVQPDGSDFVNSGQLCPRARRRLRSLRRFVFVSYAKRDEARVKPAHTVALAHGHVLWTDPFEIDARRWSADIEAAIRASHGVIIFWSVDAFASKDVSREIAAAMRFGKPILLVFLDDIQAPDALLYCLSIAIQANDPKWSEKITGALATLPRTAVFKLICLLHDTARADPSIRPSAGAPRAKEAISPRRTHRRGPRCSTISIGSLAPSSWSSRRSLLCGAPWSAADRPLPESSPSWGDNAGAAYVTSLERLGEKARRLRNDHCGGLSEAGPPPPGAGRGKARAACLSNPDS